MIDYRSWLENSQKTNLAGGIDPVTDKQIKKFKHADLITLPENVKGTNCGNCKFVKNHFCTHPEVKEPVNDRMCCSYWDNQKVKRTWEK